MSETILFILFVVICVCSVARMAAGHAKAMRCGDKGKTRRSAIRLAGYVAAWLALLAYAYCRMFLERDIFSPVVFLCAIVCVGLYSVVSAAVEWGRTFRGEDKGSKVFCGVKFVALTIGWIAVLALLVGRY